MKFLIFVSLFLVGLAQASVPVEETRIKIAVIDTGVDVMTKDLRPFLCARGHKSFVDKEPLKDEQFKKHGTNIAGLIAQNLDSTKQCLLILRFFKDSKASVIPAIRYAIEQKVAFINMSLGGEGSDEREKAAIEEALKKGIKVAVAAGNDGKDLNQECTYFPACYNFPSPLFHIVGSNTKNAEEKDYSNHGEMVKFLENGTKVGTPENTGTSQSTAIHMGKWASGKIK